MPDITPPNRRHARYGLALFFVYLALYGLFVVLTAFAPSVMARPLIAGVNTAVLSGLGLIVLAFVLAILYMILCRDSEGTGQ